MIDLPPELDTPEFHAAWASWEAHRREIRHKLTPTSVKRQIAALKGLGVAKAIATIEHSIMQGWQGLFPESVPEGKKDVHSGLKLFAERELP